MHSFTTCGCEAARIWHFSVGCTCAQAAFVSLCFRRRANSPQRAAQRSEHQNERSQCGISVKSRDVSPGSGPSSGGWFFFIIFFLRDELSQFPSVRALRALGARRLSATEMASPSAVVWLQPVQRRQQEHHAAAAQRTQIRAAAAASIAAEMTPSPWCKAWEEAASFSSSKQLSCSRVRSPFDRLKSQVWLLTDCSGWPLHKRL